MIPQKSNRQVSSNGLGDSKAFGISRKDEAHIMGILRDTLYTDKILAVLREYSSNAWDAHREAGKGDVPIKVTLPTFDDPKLTIRDYGRGLSPEDVFEIYTQYGASTKRETDEAVGTLGIGSKAGFAYSDTFTVTSFYGGSKRVYVALLGDDDVGTINLVHEESSGEKGIQIEIAVSPKDICEFQYKAQGLFKWFRPKPDINIQLPKIEQNMVLDNGVILGTIPDRYGYKTGGVWVAMMGCVPYAIKLDEVVRESELAEYARSECGVLFFDIGEVDINASREELKYSDRTRKALMEKFDLLLDEFVGHILKTLTKEDLPSWDKRKRLSSLRRLRFKILDTDYGLEGLFGDAVKIEPPKEFRLTKSDRKDSVGSIVLSDFTKLVIKDDSRSLKGFDLLPNEYLVRRSSPIPFDKLRKLLDRWCENQRIDGIPISKLSERPWTAPAKASRSTTRNDKYFRKRFELTGQTFYSPFSRDWTPNTEDPKSDDVFVILEAFHSTVPNFSQRIRRIQSICEFFKKPFPTIYGYKSTEKKPVTKSMCTGIYFTEWEKKFYEDLDSPELRKDIWTMRIVESISSPFYFFNRNSDGVLVRDTVSYGRGAEDEFEKRLRLVCESLGEDHAISKLFREFLEARTDVKGWSQTKIDILRKLVGSDEFSNLDKIDDRTRPIAKKYFMLESSDTSVWEITSHWEDWVRYFKLVDSEARNAVKSEIKEMKNGYSQVHAI